MNKIAELMNDMEDAYLTDYIQSGMICYKKRRQRRIISWAIAAACLLIACIVVPNVIHRQIGTHADDDHGVQVTYNSFDEILAIVPADSMAADWGTKPLEFDRGTGIFVKEYNTGLLGECKLLELDFQYMTSHDETIPVYARIQFRCHSAQIDALFQEDEISEDGLYEYHQGNVICYYYQVTPSTQTNDSWEGWRAFFVENDTIFTIAICSTEQGVAQEIIESMIK